MQTKAIIKTDECIGCESCVELCPEVFGFDDEAENTFVLIPETKSVRTNVGEFNYDYLIMACGVRHFYFGMPAC
jgi:ferredoxin